MCDLSRAVKLVVRHLPYPMLVVCVYCNDAAMTNHPPHRNDHDTNHNYHSITPTAHSTAPTSAPAAQPVNAAKVNRHSVILIFVIIQQVFLPSRPSCSRPASLIAHIRFGFMIKVYPILM